MLFLALNVLNNGGKKEKKRKQCRIIKSLTGSAWRRHNNSKDLKQKLLKTCLDVEAQLSKNKNKTSPMYMYPKYATISLNYPNVTLLSQSDIHSSAYYLLWFVFRRDICETTWAPTSHRCSI